MAGHWSAKQFQSTLPYGSDGRPKRFTAAAVNFNPRSLTGATIAHASCSAAVNISIHAPLRERQVAYNASSSSSSISIHAPLRERPFSNSSVSFSRIFQSTLPYGSDRIKTKYFSIHLNQAFIANRLNSNPQRFYFDVRKLLVSHSSSSCEPKLNFMFHITSHRINLDYFSSCQSICK